MSEATRIGLSSQFIRNFPVPIDRDFVFPISYAGGLLTRDEYITDARTSGLAYSGMIIADLTANKIYMLGTSGNPATRAWLEVGAESVDDLFSTSGIMVKTGNNTFASRGIDSGSNINITNASGLAANPIISLSTSVTGISSISADTGVFISGNFSSALTVGGIGVSLSGHEHSWPNITNFCSGVADCVDTALVATTGIQSVYNSGANTLSLGLSGQALALHNFTSSGILVRTGPSSFSAITISGDSNISVSSGNGVGGNPTISLQDAVSVGSLSTTGNVIIGNNLIVNGSTITANIDTITIEDPIITLGLSSGNIVPTLNYDRGLALVRGTGLTAFMGWTNSDQRFVMLSSGNASANSGNYTGTYGTLQIGELYSSYVNATGMMINGAASIGGPLSVSNIIQNQLIIAGSENEIISLDVATYPNLTELSYVKDVTGYIQTQLNNRMVAAGSVTSGNIPIWANTSGNLLASGYAVSSSSGNNTVVLRNASGAFSAGNITANSFIRSDGTSSQFLKGDGSVDTNTYITTVSVGTGILTLGVSGSGISGSATFGANQNSGTTFTITSNATSSNTVNTIVLRDSLGNFNTNMIGINTAISGINTITYSSNTVAYYGSTSISGIAANNYLFNFIVDGGTP